MGEIFAALRDALRSQRPAALVTMVRGPNVGAKLLVTNDGSVGTLGGAELDHAVGRDAAGMLELGLTAMRSYGSAGEGRLDDVELFIQSFVTPPRMYVFGAIDFAAAVVRIGKLLGYNVTLCDPRAAFATRERFPEADEIVVEWPDEFLARAEVDARSAICALTHDPKFDVPLLKAALATPASYIGAMGSRRTHAHRVQDLVEEGVSEEDLARISGPIGLDIGARTAEEVAVSIAAEIIALKTGAAGERLTETDGPIHHGGEEAEQ